MRKALSVLGMACLISTASMGQAPVITSFQGNGTLTWAYPSNEVMRYHIEWASKVDGPWINTWEGLRDIAPTGHTMAAAVPMFYRVAADLLDFIVIDLSAGPTATNYPVVRTNAMPSDGWGDEYKTTKMVLQHISPGTFLMGSPAGEAGKGLNETQHEVTLTQPFYIGVFEVTQKQWERVMGTWPSYFTNATYRESRPVEMVSYRDIRGTVEGANWPTDMNVDADSFMGRLRARTGRTFDLPTESQWEYAGRSGTATSLNSGYNVTNVYGVDSHVDAVARYFNNGYADGLTANVDTSLGTAAVGSYMPHAGLYDIHGNVREWCLDWWSDTYPGTVTDPKGTTSGTWREYRGGSWYDSAGYCRLAQRDGYIPAGQVNSIGCRAVVVSNQ
jgi:formylglycine-generating enzyme required for sulfatase activity